MPRREDATKGLLRQFWRANKEKVRVQEAGAVSSTEIDIYLPTGDMCQISTRRRNDGLVDFIKLPPEEWVTKQATDYFLTGGV